MARKNRNRRGGKNKNQQQPVAPQQKADSVSQTGDLKSANPNQNRQAANLSPRNNQSEQRRSSHHSQEKLPPRNMNSPRDETRQQNHQKDRGSRPNRQDNQKRSAQQRAAQASRPVLIAEKNPIAAFEKALPRSLKVVFFKSVQEARQSLAQIEKEKAACEQLNIVIKDEGPINDEELSRLGTVYAGEAWTLIHQRRMEEGWYTNAAGSNVANPSGSLSQ